MRIGIIAGEASGDLLGAKLLQALAVHCPPLEIEGIGGPAMIAAGCNSLFDMEQLSVMGFGFDLIKRIPQLIHIRRSLYRHFMMHPPDIFIGIDAPEFNIGLELKLRQAGIPVIHYVSPSVWAWRKRRIHKIAKAVDLMLTLLPFEAKFYQQHQVPVTYVGHPLAEDIPLEIDTLAARRTLCIDENATYVALLPGSRSQEIRHMAEPLLLAAKMVYQQNKNVQFITSHVNEQRYQEFLDYAKQYAPELPLLFFTRRSHDVMAASDVVVVTSGTATLETMLYKKPMIIAYRMSFLTYQLAKLLVNAPFIGLPNLLANELLVPELIQDEVKPETIAAHILDYLNHPEKVKQLQKRFLQLHRILYADSTELITQAILRMLKQTEEVDLKRAVK